MKSKFIKLTICLLAITITSAMMLSVQAIGTKVTKQNTDVTYDYKWTSNTTDLSYNDKNKYIMEVTITIPKKATDTIQINFNDVYKNYMTLRKQNGMATTTNSMPGDSYPMKIKIVNNSTQKYSYKNNSLVIEPGVSDFGKMAENDATIALLDQDGDDKITAQELIQLYTVLEEKGYQNNGTALERYLVSFTNEKYGINVKDIAELVRVYPQYAGIVLGGDTYDLSKPVTSTLRVKLSLDEANKYAANYKWFNDYAVQGSKAGVENGIQKYYFEVIYPEYNLGKQSSVLFYQNYISIGYGKGINKAELNTSAAAKLITSSSQKLGYKVNDYVVKNNSYSEMNDFLKDVTEVDAWIDNTCSFNYTIALASSIGNAYVDSSMSYNNTIILEKVINEGDVTVNKTLDLNNFKTNDQPTFIYKLTDSKGIEHYKTISFKETETNKSVKFEGIPLGNYKIEEIDTIRYEVKGDSIKKGILTKDNYQQSVSIINQKQKNNDFSDTNVIINSFKKTNQGIEISQNNFGTQ